jgi:hypothetical protein
MIKIATGYSEKGGSTILFINLTNELNKRGYETIFYGPHDFHLGKCKSDKLKNIVINNDDILICHYLQLPSRPAAKKVILASLEKWWFMVGEINKYWDIVTFSHEAHREYHSKYEGPYVTIPNIKSDLKPSDKKGLDLVAGIIGGIEDRKQTHKSIQKAIADGCTKIKVFGHIADQAYYDKYVKPVLTDIVEFVGYTTDKQSMYDSVGRVYHLSKGEVATLVKDDCYLTNTKFFGNEESENEVSTLSNDEIINKWVKLFEI